MAIRRKQTGRGSSPRDRLKRWRATVTYHEPTYDLHRGRPRQNFTESMVIDAESKDEAIRKARVRVGRYSAWSQVSWIREITRVEVKEIGVAAKADLRGYCRKLV